MKSWLTDVYNFARGYVGDKGRYHKLKPSFYYVFSACLGGNIRGVVRVALFFFGLVCVLLLFFMYEALVRSTRIFQVCLI